LFSRVMRDGLLTGVGAKRPGCILFGPILSEPHDYANSVQNTTYLFL